MLIVLESNIIIIKLFVLGLSHSFPTMENEINLNTLNVWLANHAFFWALKLFPWNKLEYCFIFVDLSGIYFCLKILEMVQWNFGEHHLLVVRCTLQKVKLAVVHKTVCHH